MMDSKFILLGVAILAFGLIIIFSIPEKNAQPYSTGQEILNAQLPYQKQMCSSLGGVLSVWTVYNDRNAPTIISMCLRDWNVAVNS